MIIITGSYIVLFSMRYYSKRFTVYYYPGHWIQYQSCTHSAPPPPPPPPLFTQTRIPDYDDYYDYDTNNNDCGINHLISRAGVVVETSSLNVYTGDDHIDANPILISGDPSFVVENFFDVTFASETRVVNGEGLFSVQYFVSDVVGSANMLSTEIVEYGAVVFDVRSDYQITFPDAPTLDLTGVLCEQMEYVCAMLVKGTSPDPDFTLQGVDGDESLLSCEKLECRGELVYRYFRSIIFFALTTPKHICGFLNAHCTYRRVPERTT